jgi:glucose-1-phosphate thymidylyltransferase
MKGVVLCGGTGSRLDPLTRVTNKHLLPIYDRPMVFFPIQTLVDAGVRDILLVTGGNNAGDFVPLLGNGADFGLSHINYTYQKGAGGIADALRLAREFADGDPVAVILGDNVFGAGFPSVVKKAIAGLRGGAAVFLKEVPDPQRFGVAEVKGDRVVGIVEKPKSPRSNLAVTGLYLYDATVFEKIETLKPSGRGELEITDVNNAYLAEGRLKAHRLGKDVSWTDAGTFESLHRANLLVAESRLRKRDGR